MALEIKQNLRLSQQLVITPQLQQAIKLLQLSRLELQELIEGEMVENPVLEETPATEGAEGEGEGDGGNGLEATQKNNDRTDEVGTKEGELKEPTDFDWENYLGTYNAFEAGAPNIKEPMDELPSFENMVPTAPSLDDHLLWQLHLSNLSDLEIEIAEEIIVNISDEGYFQGNLQEIAEHNGVNESEVAQILEKIQGLDPPGVGARTLQECLKLQARTHQESYDYLCKIIDDHLSELERHNYQAIAKKMGLSPEEVEQLAHIIHMMEPKPGRPFGGENPQYIIPDVYVQKVGDEYIVMLNEDGLPKLQVSNFYRNAMMGKGTAGKTKEYIQEKLRSAIWLIRSIHQRQRTLYRVSRAIVKFQQDFFEMGVSHLKPMVLKDVADEIGMHESTISRVTTSKYMQTPRGIFELKFFFNTRVPSSTEEGTTSEAVKDKIRKLISKEDTTKPLSDQAIADILANELDTQVARRTVAKYRETIGILPSSRRRRLPPLSYKHPVSNS